MDRTQLLLVGLPLFLLCSDLFNLFAPPPPKSDDHHHHQHHHHPPPKSKSQPVIQQPSLEFPTEKASGVGAIGFGNTDSIDFCSSCSYRAIANSLKRKSAVPKKKKKKRNDNDVQYDIKIFYAKFQAPNSLELCCREFLVTGESVLQMVRGTAVTMKNMLETQFPGINVVLANYPPPFPKRALSKLVPVVQIGVMSIVMAGEHIFPRLGFAVSPPWYYSLRANRFGTISSTWLLGNFLQSILQSSGAFEVYCNRELVFSKLKENRFPGEIELKDLISKKIASSRIVDGLGGAHWS